MMNNLLQQHGAKYLFRVPDGLYELCSDISRETLRSQPSQMLNFMADYVETLLLTRESAKVAVELVDGITAKSESIVNLLNRCGLNPKEIAGVAPMLQKVFHDYVYNNDCTCSIESDSCAEDTCSQRNEH